MTMSCLAVTAEKHVVGGIEEQEMCARAGAVQRVELFLRVGEERTAARVDHEGDLLLSTSARDVDRRRHQRRREVIDGVVAEVLEELHRGRFARAGKPGEYRVVRL